jgi:hypothetical protein
MECSDRSRPVFGSALPPGDFDSGPARLPLGHGQFPPTDAASISKHADSGLYDGRRGAECKAAFELVDGYHAVDLQTIETLEPPVDVLGRLDDDPVFPRTPPTSSAKSGVSSTCNA